MSRNPLPDYRNHTTDTPACSRIQAPRSGDSCEQYAVPFGMSSETHATAVVAMKTRCDYRSLPWRASAGERGFASARTRPASASRHDIVSPDRAELLSSAFRRTPASLFGAIVHDRPSASRKATLATCPRTIDIGPVPSKKRLTGTSAGPLPVRVRCSRLSRTRTP